MGMLFNYTAYYKDEQTDPALIVTHTPKPTLTLTPKPSDANVVLVALKLISTVTVPFHEALFTKSGTIN